MMTSMVSIILGFILMIGQNPGYINKPAVVHDPTIENPTDFERERSVFLDHVDNITHIDETKNGETTQILTEIPLDSDYSKLNQYSRFDNWGLDYDKNGNLTQKSTQKMYFDYKNRMVRVTEATTTTESKYDALGRRLQKIFTAGSQTKTENYYYSGQQVVEVRDGSDQVKRQFIYGNGVDEVVRMDVYSGSTATPYYFHTNEIGSTTAVTDANGMVVERYKYGLFGMPTFMDAAGNVIPKSAIGNNILFQGREYEPETNFYYFRARHLDPIMGRFLQVDPMGYQDRLNLYQAFNMNPINFVDPMGLQEKEFQVMCMYPDNKLEDILIMQEAARRGYAKGALALGIGLAAAPLSGPTIIALVGSTLIYTGLDEYSERLKAGQSPYEARAGTIVNKMSFGLYDIIKGRDPGTGEKIKAEERALRGMDWLGQMVAGSGGFISGNTFFGINPSTFQLMDEAFNAWKGYWRQANSSGGYGVYPIETPGGVRWKDPKTGRFAKTPSKGKTVIGHYSSEPGKGYVNVAKELDATFLQLPDRLLNKLWDSGKFKEIWNFNKLFLQEALKRGDEIILATDLLRKFSFFGRELWFLRSMGIDISKLTMFLK